MNKKQNRWRRELRKLANFFKKNAWIRCRYRKLDETTGNFSYCLVGGLDHITNDIRRNYAIQKKAIYKVCGSYPIPYNDEVAKSKEDIINVLQKAAEVDL